MRPDVRYSLTSSNVTPPPKPACSTACSSSGVCGAPSQEGAGWAGKGAPAGCAEATGRDAGPAGAGADAGAEAGWTGAAEAAWAGAAGAG